MKGERRTQSLRLGVSAGRMMEHDGKRTKTGVRRKKQEFGKNCPQGKPQEDRKRKSNVKKQARGLRRKHTLHHRMLSSQMDWKRWWM
jgi:hypothetical protein